MSEDLHSLVGSYVADALDAEERDAFERHLRACGDCRREVADLREVVLQLGADDVGPPPAGLKERVLAEIEHVDQEAAVPQVDEPAEGTPHKDAKDAAETEVKPFEGPQSAVEVEASPGSGGAVVRSLGERRSTRSRRPWALAAAASVVALVVLAGVLGAAVTRLQDRVASLQVANEQVAQLLTAERVRAVALAQQGDSRARIMWSPVHGAGVLVADGMPAAPRQHEYQVWFVHDDVQVSAGTVQVGADGNATVVVTGDLDTATAVMVTVEPLGGSEQPTGEPLMHTAVPLGGATQA